ncbi:MAG: hypothetical protein ABSD03_15810 [Vulcanimicrobiaceae bacterium]
MKPLSLGERIARAEAWCRNGRRPKRAAAALGMSGATLAGWLNTQDYVNRRVYRRFVTAEREHIAKRALEGAAAKTVARELGRSTGTVQKFAADHGISFRSRFRWTAAQRSLVVVRVDDLIEELAKHLRADTGAVAQQIVKAAMSRKRREQTRLSA